MTNAYAFEEHAAWVMYTNEVPPKGLQRLICYL